MQKPLFAVGLLSSVLCMTAGIVANPFCLSDFFTYPGVVFAVMVYLVAKIINPTQGMTLDYQLLELKLISLTDYKLLLSARLLGGSILLSLICLTSYTKMTAVISALNAAVNVWVFLRNRWNNRIYDLLAAVVVVFAMRYQALYLSLLSMALTVGIDIVLKRVNYASILSLYKLIYKIGQQRYHGVVYSEKESRDIQTGAETLIGRVKEKHVDWCERLFDKDCRFEMHKELARITANSDRFIACFIICIVIGISGFYIPSEYVILAFALLAGTALSFDMTMNRAEANLLLRGFTGRYVVADIVKNKLPVYTVVNFILMLPSVLLGWKWMVFSFFLSYFAALFSLYKCFGGKAK